MSAYKKIRRKKILFSWMQFLLVLLLSSLLLWASTQRSLIIDMTQNSIRSISAASVALLNQVQGPLTITAYARENLDLRTAIRVFIGRYQSVKQDINLEFVNPDSVPDRLRELGIQVNGELVLDYQGRTEHVRYADEHTLINAIARITQERQSWIAFLSGHGERDMLGSANHDLGDFGFRLTERGYNIQPINLAEIPDIPDNTSALVLAGPQIPLSNSENLILQEYLKAGGNLLWLVDQGDLDYLSDELPRFLNIEIANGVVIDTASKLLGSDDPTLTIITESLYVPHPILTNFSYTTIFPQASAILPADSNVWGSSPLLMTGEQAWLETSPLDSEVRFDSDADLTGPITIGVALTRNLDHISNSFNTDKEQRIVVIGDGDFLSNTYLENSGNLELGTRIMSWLSFQDNLIEVPVRTVSDTQLTVPPYFIGAIGIFFLIVMPLASISMAASLWRKKRQTR
jgi:hypothetical protein